MWNSSPFWLARLIILAAEEKQIHNVNVSKQTQAVPGSLQTNVVK